MAADATKAHPALTGGDDAQSARRLSIAEHPRAARLVRQARQAAGLAGFLIAGWTSLATNTLAGTLLHALVAGIVCQVVVWAAAVLLFKHLIVAELKSREHALMQAATARIEAHERAQGEPPQRNGGGVSQGGARP